MPWSYPDNVPPSMKYFKPSIQKKAIRIANHVLETSGDEGMAISTGIKKAKQHSLIKMASWKNVVINKLHNAFKHNDPNEINREFQKMVKKLKGQNDGFNQNRH